MRRRRFPKGGSLYTTSTLSQACSMDFDGHSFPAHQFRALSKLCGLQEYAPAVLSAGASSSPALSQLWWTESDVHSCNRGRKARKALPARRGHLSTSTRPCDDALVAYDQC